MNSKGLLHLGSISAGFPLRGEEETQDSMKIEDYLVDHPQASYLLRAKGNSMKDIGIQDGDFLVVEKGIEPKDGSIVVAEIDGDFTMKFFRKKNGKVCLEAANEEYPDFYPEQSLSVIAVVKGVFRKYS